MNPEVEGTSPWGPSRKRVLKCLKGPKTTYTPIAIAEKQSKRSKKGPFSLYIGSPRVLPRRWNSWGPEGKVPPGPPGFSSHASNSFTTGLQEPHCVVACLYVHISLQPSSSASPCPFRRRPPRLYLFEATDDGPMFHDLSQRHINFVLPRDTQIHRSSFSL